MQLGAWQTAFRERAAAAVSVHCCSVKRGALLCAASQARVSKTARVTDVRVMGSTRPQQPQQRRDGDTEGKTDVTDWLRGINNFKNMLAALEERIALARERLEARLVPVMERLAPALAVASSVYTLCLPYAVKAFHSCSHAAAASHAVAVATGDILPVVVEDESSFALARRR